MPECGRTPGAACAQTLQRCAPPPCDHCSALAESGFSSGRGACPWSCGFDTEALLSAKDSILELQGSLRCLLRCCNFILGKFLSFPGDEAWAALAPAWAVAEGLESCFVIRVSKRGCGVWESPARAVTTTGQKWGPFPPPLSHFLLLFVKSGY